MAKRCLAVLLLAGCHSSIRADVPPAGALLRCESSGKNAYETYGPAAFFAVHQALLDNLNKELADNGPGNLGDSFSKIGSGDPPSTKHDRAAFRGYLAAFLVYLYGGPASTTYVDGKTYQGDLDMVTAHKGLKITSA